ncbi:uncharacterized protein LOC121986969 [Zingiber officinale]|uniref:uncharacterized protein LOC121986969 n=1 Tax=Zingiber officinale TaxID=94328 RepID=UPI001C4CFF5D|nr:uncharacterized protein LOC121986969 [Zingiber officinale]
MGKAAAADGGRCRRHPEHRQSVGVCPFCLTEKLQRHLSHRSSTATSSCAVAGALSFYSSAYSSDDDSDDASSSVSYEDAANRPRGSGGRQLMKSWSLAFVARGRRKERVKKEEKGKKERFWRKLFSSSIVRKKKKKEERFDLMHSQTYKEKSSAKWIY